MELVARSDHRVVMENWGVDVQKSQAKHNTNSNLLFYWRLQVQYHANWECICDQVRGDIQCRIRKIKGVDVDTHRRRSHRRFPGASNGAALKNAGENKGESLTSDDSHHDDGHTAKGFVAKSHIQRQHGELNEA